MEMITKTYSSNENACMDRNQSILDNRDEIFHYSEIMALVDLAKINRMQRSKDVSIKNRPIKGEEGKVSVMISPNVRQMKKKINLDGIKGIHIMKAANNKTTTPTTHMNVYLGP